MTDPAPDARDTRGGGTPRLTRRGFLTKGAAAVAGASAVAAALSPLKDLPRGDWPTLERLLQKHYKEMTPAEKEAVLARIAREVERRFTVTPRLSDPPPRHAHLSLVLRE